ncbi:MAG TPA: polysaccharide biosynthesis protein, partial [Actinotalea sp.]|nr:polysaccharide biosynthesis protein [Actinotalea sp.]
MAEHTRPSPDTLLGRPEQHHYSEAAHRLVDGRRVLVTGAAGSIGSELVRQLHHLDPATVIEVDIDEGRLHALQLELRGVGFMPGSPARLVDVTHRATLESLVAAERPEIVFHAAAHKHLAMLERFPCQAVRSNVLGTRNVVEAAVRHGARTVVNVSTDKAADPRSVLGGTKRLAEQVAGSARRNGTDVASVRFGNVLGSRGSFLDTLAYQMTNDLPVTLTHPAVTRYLMSIREAASLVVEAAAMAGRGGAFVLDMGQPVPMIDLITAYAEQSGLPAPDIRIIGLQPGEKLHESLLASDQARHAVDGGEVYVVLPEHPWWAQNS